MSLHLKTKTVREITGGWLSFVHPNPQEAEYWNDTARRFSAGDWETKVHEMAALGMDTIVVAATVLREKAFYPSEVVPDKWEMACDDPLQAVLAAADRHGMHVFVGAGCFKRSGDETPVSDWEAEVPRELHERYGSHDSFHGWYLPVEGEIDRCFSDPYIESVNRRAELCRRVDGRRPILISPQGAHTIDEEDRFVEQLRRLKVDHFAYRDEVGARKNEPSELAVIFRRLENIHEKADLPLWATIDLYAFEGPTGESAIVPAAFPRVKTQLEAVSPHVRKILCWQFPGLMNPGSSTAFAGHPTSAELHHDYYEWQCEQADQGLR